MHKENVALRKPSPATVGRLSPLTPPPDAAPPLMLPRTTQRGGHALRCGFLLRQSPLLPSCWGMERSENSNVYLGRIGRLTSAHSQLQIIHDLNVHTLHTAV